MESNLSESARIQMDCMLTGLSPPKGAERLPAKKEPAPVKELSAREKAINDARKRLSEIKNK